ncbi:hypothetical protein Efla_004934 [Eimeria flavescens]
MGRERLSLFNARWQQRLAGLRCAIRAGASPQFLKPPSPCCFSAAVCCRYRAYRCRLHAGRAPAEVQRAFVSSLLRQQQQPAEALRLAAAAAPATPHEPQGTTTATQQRAADSSSNDSSSNDSSSISNNSNSSSSSNNSNDRTSSNNGPSWSATEEVVRLLRQQQQRQAAVIPFKVRRTASDNLPVSLSWSHSRSQVRTVIRKVAGDRQALMEELAVLCEAPVWEGEGCICVSGNKKALVKQVTLPPRRSNDSHACNS